MLTSSPSNQSRINKITLDFTCHFYASFLFELPEVNKILSRYRKQCGNYRALWHRYQGEDDTIQFNKDVHSESREVNDPRKRQVHFRQCTGLAHCAKQIRKSYKVYSRLPSGLRARWFWMVLDGFGWFWKGLSCLQIRGNSA